MRQPLLAERSGSGFTWPAALEINLSLGDWRASSPAPRSRESREHPANPPILQEGKRKPVEVSSLYQVSTQVKLAT